MINTSSIKRTAAEIRKLVTSADAEKVRRDGYAIVSIWLQPRDKSTEVGVDALIAVNDEGESPIGLVLTSNGTLEQSILRDLARTLDER